MLKSPNLSSRLRYTIRLLLAALGLLAALVLAGVLYEAAASAYDRRTYLPPGELVDVGGHKLHLYVMGEDHDGPTVILEAGSGGTSLSWTYVQRGLAETVRVVSYDRPGFGWSEPGTQPYSAQQIAQDLHAGLQALDIEPPYVLVGHSMGGLYVRLYAAAYPDEVVGMVLVDASHEDKTALNSAFADAPGIARTLARLEPTPLLARLGILRLTNTGWGGTYGYPEAERRAINALTIVPTYYETRIAELRALPAINDAVRAVGDLGNMPLIVLTAGAETTDAWNALQADLAALSTQGEVRIVAGATHLALLSDPTQAEAVVDAVRDVLEAVAR